MTAPLEEKEDEPAEETLSRWLGAEYTFAEDRLEILQNCIVMELDGLSAAQRTEMSRELELMVQKYQAIEFGEEPN